MIALAGRDADVPKRCGSDAVLGEDLLGGHEDEPTGRLAADVAALGAGAHATSRRGRLG